jgi:hypothetical protein
MMKARLPHPPVVRLLPVRLLPVSSILVLRLR